MSIAFSYSAYGWALIAYSLHEPAPLDYLFSQSLTDSINPHFDSFNLSGKGINTVFIFGQSFVIASLADKRRKQFSQIALITYTLPFQPFRGFCQYPQRCYQRR